MSEMWDSVAPGWEANAEFVDEQLALATDALLDAAQIGEGDRVLDLAAGPGGAGLAAAQRVGSTGRVVLSDAAIEMVAVAAKRVGDGAQLSTAVFDQSAIDYSDDASFDAVINRHGLMFVEDPAETVAEAVRVLRDRGRYAVMTLGSPRGEPVARAGVGRCGRAIRRAVSTAERPRPVLARHPRRAGVRSTGWRISKT